MRESNRLKLQTRWNFSDWQKQNKKRRENQHKKLLRNQDLAELIGIVLGDGNLYRFPRTENLRISCHSKDVAYIQHISELINQIFEKKPSLRTLDRKKSTLINLYQNRISERLGLPTGDKIKNNVGIPLWILSNKLYIIKCLKGLFETDGCFCEDKKNYTQIIEFKNSCKHLRKDVYYCLLKLNFTPQFGKNYVRVAKKKEAYRLKESIDFRNYIAL